MLKLPLGSDLMLIELVHAALKAASWPTKISTGRLMYKLGDNVRNVDGTHLEESSKGFLEAQEHLRAFDALTGDDRSLL